MKFLMVLMALSGVLTAAAQKAETVTDTSASQIDLYNRSLRWIGQTWGTNAGKVVESQDDATGVIVVKGGLKAAPQTAEGTAVKGLTVTELQIAAENGRSTLKFVRTQFNWDAGTTWNFEDENGGAQQDKWKADVLKEIDEMIASYKAAVAK